MLSLLLAGFDGYFGHFGEMEFFYGFGGGGCLFVALHVFCVFLWFFVVLSGLGRAWKIPFEDGFLLQKFFGMGR